MALPIFQKRVAHQWDVLNLVFFKKTKKSNLPIYTEQEKTVTSFGASDYTPYWQQI